jgi:recombination protein RecA
VKAVEKELNKEAGMKVIQRMGEQVNKPRPSIPTGLPSVDNYAIGCGGFPKGTVIEIYGPESSGKTTVALHVVGQAQRQGGIAAFVDAEHALDPTYASKLGVNMDELLVSQPDHGEQAFTIVEALVKSGGVDIIVVDSVAALVPRAELEGDYGDSHMGLHARLMSQALRKLTGIVAKSKTVVIFINQVREKVGVVYGNPEVTTGGRALKFYSSVRMEIRKVTGEAGKITEGDEHIGHRIRMKVVKNKVGNPFRETQFDLLYDKGIDTRGNVIEFAGEKGVLTLGSWCTFRDEKYRRKDLTVEPLFGRIMTELNKILASESQERADGKEEGQSPT